MFVTIPKQYFSWTLLEEIATAILDCRPEDAKYQIIDNPKATQIREGKENFAACWQSRF
jgi:hypothetical protein